MLGNCDELLEHMVDQYILDYVSDEDGFQGDPIKFEHVLPTNKEYRCGEFIWALNFNMLFFVQYEHRSEFNLYLFGTYPLVKAVAVTLPGYVRNELIDTLKGEW